MAGAMKENDRKGLPCAGRATRREIPLSIRYLLNTHFLFRSAR
jgi:hypothetical protein